MAIEKQKFIKYWPSPTNIHEVITFHRFPSFYRKFIRNFDHICALVVEIIMKEYQPFRWTTIEKDAFQLK